MSISHSFRDRSALVLISLVLFLSILSSPVTAQQGGEGDFLWHKFTGPEANESAVEDSEKKWGFLDNKRQCIYKGEPVDEGKKLDIGKADGSWENGSYSSDKEICVYTDSFEVGGEWVDLDSSAALDYLGKKVEYDCHSGLWGGNKLKCEDRGSDEGSEPPLWAPFKEGGRDDDFDSNNNADLSFEGLHNRINVSSTNSHVDNYNIEWAFTPYLNYSIDQEGTAYPPTTCYPKGNNRVRTSEQDSTVDKNQRVMNNSYASPQGVWEDPDEVKALDFNCDLTGPDIGIGLNTSGTPSIDDSGTGIEVKGRIKFDDLGKSNVDMNPPVCGDDQDEYLVSELGQSKDGYRDKGLFCIPKPVEDQCIDSTGGEIELVDLGVVRQMNEIGENEGRLKNDKEVCAKLDGSNSALWVDQDHEEKLCQENSLYGEEGVRWISDDAVESNPKAFIGGIDDSGHTSLDEITNTFNSLQGEIDGGIAADETPVPTGTDVSNPPQNLITDWTTSKGFCLGDDQSEYLVTQKCSSNLCETRDQITGAAKVPGSCVFEPEGSKHPVVSENARKIYSPGDKVKLSVNGENRFISCFNGKWIEKWPITFNQREVDIQLGAEKLVGYEVINPKAVSKKYRVELKNTFADQPSAYQFASFQNKEESDSFEVEIAPESSKTFYLNVEGGSSKLNGIGQSRSEILIGASGINSDISGEDSVYINVKEGTSQSSKEGQSEDVPGISFLHIIAITIGASILYWRQV